MLAAATSFLQLNDEGRFIPDWMKLVLAAATGTFYQTIVATLFLIVSSCNAAALFGALHPCEC